MCGEDLGLVPAAFSVTFLRGLWSKELKGTYISLQEGGCSVPVAVHTVMKDGQVSWGKWMRGRDWHFHVHPNI